MTDRVKALTVVFERDIREDDVEPIAAAIRQLRGVLKVTPIVAGVADHIAHERVRRELIGKLYDVLAERDSHPSDKP